VTLGNQSVFQANSVDSIRCKNQFYGGQVGFASETIFGQFYLQGRTTLAAGAMRQDVTIASASFFPTLNTGGTIFNQGDVGKKTRTQVSFIPELDLRMGWQFCHYCRVYVGYDGLIVTNVLRPGALVVPGGTSVAATVGGTTNQANVSQNQFIFQDSKIFINGLTFGCELRF
jgi:hypothetical protein